MSNHKQSIRFLTYSIYHGKYEPVGSDFIRVHQLLKYWPQARLYKYGENPGVLIFTKVFASQDYQFPINFKGFKILDICDPMWLEGFNIVETAQAMDAITCSTQSLADFMSQFHSNVHFVADRFDLAEFPPPKKHQGKAKTVVWFGYSHNAETLKPALKIIEELELNLLVISNDNPLFNQYSARQDWYKYKSYGSLTKQEEYLEMQKADFALLPWGNRPQDVFKSNNRDIKANLCGLPVAKTADEVRALMNAKSRQKWVDTNYVKITRDYDVQRSVEQLEEIINDKSS